MDNIIRAPCSALENENMALPSQSHGTLFVPELLEQILLHLPARKIVSAQRVCTFWNTLINNSPSLRKWSFKVAVLVQEDDDSLFLESDATMQIHQFGPNTRGLSGLFSIYEATGWTDFTCRSVRRALASGQISIQQYEHAIEALLSSSDEHPPLKSRGALYRTDRLPLYDFFRRDECLHPALRFFKPTTTYWTGSEGHVFFVIGDSWHVVARIQEIVNHLHFCVTLALSAGERNWIAQPLTYPACRKFTATTRFDGLESSLKRKGGLKVGDFIRVVVWACQSVMDSHRKRIDGLRKWMSERVFADKEEEREREKDVFRKLEELERATREE